MGNSAHTEDRRAGDDADGVHRLRDIVVEEVSLVDRAANKRRFLVVKRSDDMGIEADETRNGETPEGDVEKAKKKKPAASDTGEVDEAKRRKPGTDETGDAEKVAASAKDEDEENEEEAEKASASSEDEADEHEDADEDEPEKKKQRKAALALTKAAKSALLGGLTDGLERLMALAKQVKDAPEAETGASVPPRLASEVSAIAGRLSELVDAGSSKTKKGEVAKGARMAKERLDRFQKALSLLAEILKELTDSKDALPTPTAGAAEAGVKKSDGTGLPAPVPGLTELVKGIGELTQVVKRQEEELGRIRQTRGVSNAIQVDGGRRTEPQDISWPLDMNRPISRDQVKKEVSFFDE